MSDYRPDPDALLREPTQEMRGRPQTAALALAVEAADRGEPSGGRFTLRVPEGPLVKGMGEG